MNMEKALSHLEQLLEDNVCCAEAILQTTLASRGEESPALVAAAKGLCGGLGSGLCCGALSGACCMLALRNPEGYRPLLRRLTAWFYETYGAWDCAALCRARGQECCQELTLEVYEAAAELLEEA